MKPGETVTTGKSSLRTEQTTINQTKKQRPHSLNKAFFVSSFYLC